VYSFMSEDVRTVGWMRFERANGVDRNILLMVFLTISVARNVVRIIMESNDRNHKYFSTIEVKKNFSLFNLYSHTAAHKVYGDEAFQLLRNHIETRYGIPVIEAYDTLDSSEESVQARVMYEDEVSGKYVYYPNQERKLVNSDARIYIKRDPNNPKPWEVFVLAHELGHHLAWTLYRDDTELTADRMVNSILFNVLPIKMLFVLWIFLSTKINIDSQHDCCKNLYEIQWRRLWDKPQNVLKSISRDLKKDFLQRGLSW